MPAGTRKTGVRTLLKPHRKKLRWSLYADVIEKSSLLAERRNKPGTAQVGVISKAQQLL